MARGSIKTPGEKLAALEAVKAKYQEKIETYKAKIAGLDNEIKSIANGKKEAELEKLLKAIIASGKTVDEVMQAVSANK